MSTRAAQTTSGGLERALDPNLLDEIVQRVVEIIQPERIILFGSAVRGEMTRHSDVDLLIVKKGVDPLDAMGLIYRNLHGVGVAIDAIVVSPESLERYKDSHALVFKSAMQEGKVVYDGA